MAVVIGLFGAGAMGSAVGARLVKGGATVLTPLDGRSAASRARAEAAGMQDVPVARVAEADIILSIVPPADAEEVTLRIAPFLGSRHVFVDFNALSPATKKAIGAPIADSGAVFVDGCIIGLPGAPILYVSGEAADRAMILGDHGVDVRRIDGPVGAAAALKMCYAGINKGQTGLGAAMLLAASRSGAVEALRGELAASQGPLLAKFDRAIPDMYGKAYRWVAEMREIAAFLEEDEAAAMIFEGFARLFDRLAKDVAGPGEERALLDAFLKRED